VELPNQVHGKLVLSRNVAGMVARHYETGEPMFDHYRQKLLVKTQYMNGATLRQLHRLLT